MHPDIGTKMKKGNEYTTPSNTFKEELERSPSTNYSIEHGVKKQPDMVSYSGVTRKSLAKADEHFRNGSLTLVSPKFRVHGQIPCAAPYTPQTCQEGK